MNHFIKLITTLCIATNIHAVDQHFVFVVCSYNNEQWCEKNLESMFNQTYRNWDMIYINDCSTDKTEELVKACITKHSMWDKVTYQANKDRYRQLANQYHAIHSCNNKDIICIVDGDDWLAHNNVLTILNQTYQDPNVWMTYGSFKKTGPGYITPSKQVPESVIRHNSIRKQRWCLSHMRTFYAGLYKKIHQQDLMLDGKFFIACSDVSTMYPMFEMAHGNYKFIKEILYIYNNQNVINVHKTDKIQSKLATLIKGMQPYAPLADWQSPEPARYDVALTK